jgi:hypothetical protein
MKVLGKLKEWVRVFAHHPENLGLLKIKCICISIPKLCLGFFRQLKFQEIGGRRDFEWCNFFKLCQIISLKGKLSPTMNNS